MEHRRTRSVHAVYAMYVGCETSSMWLVRRGVSCLDDDDDDDGRDGWGCGCLRYAGVVYG